MTQYLTKDGKKYPIVDISEIVFYQEGEPDSYTTFCSKKELREQGYTFDELRWKPSKNQTENQRFWYLDNEGDIEYGLWIDSKLDNFLYSIGNVFKPDDTAGLENYRLKLLELGK